MKRITWTNLTPPGFKSEDVLNYLIAPAIFNNPQLKDRIQRSSFYSWQVTVKASAESKKAIGKKSLETRTNFLSFLENKTNRSRMFSYSKDARASAERMLNLLLGNVSDVNNTSYNLNTYPIRHEFKKQWVNLLAQDKFHIRQTNYPTFSREAVATFKAYVCAMIDDYDGLKNQWYEMKAAEHPIACSFDHFSDDMIPEFVEKLENALNKSVSGNSAKRDPNDVMFTLENASAAVTLDSLIKSIDTFPYTDTSSLYYTDDAHYALFSESDNLFFERLASMSLIASVWYAWENAASYQAPLLHLSNLIFPKAALAAFNSDITAAPSQEDNDATAESDMLIATQLLAKIKTAVEEQRFNDAGKDCEEVFLNHKHASDEIMGKVLSYLVICCENCYRLPHYFHSINDIIREAISYDSPYLSKEKTDIRSTPPVSRLSTSGRYTINCSGSAVPDWIVKTAPKHWEKFVCSVPESTLVANQNQKIYLVDDNYDVNIQDAINVLDTIKRSINDKNTEFEDWKKLELYIRCDEDVVTPVLDTALSYFTESTQSDHDKTAVIKIFLLDEEKRSAEYLFAKHPHFYPLTLAKNKDKDVNIHLVLLSNNINVRYAEWLIKEAFWTLPRYDATTRAMITVLSPHASKICEHVSSNSPGLASMSTVDNVRVSDEKPLQISGLLLPSIEYKNISFTSSALNVELEKYDSASEYFYYIVDSDSDTAAIDLGRRIRENIVRKTVISGHSNSYSKYNSVIAIRCFNSDLAELATELIVPKEEEHGKKWFNDYNLISFGSRKDLYSWDNLSGGMIETVSQAIHLHYMNSSFADNDYEAKLNSYFERLYNHDSSFCAAVSMPYRLYEAGVYPDAWFIKNDNVWWNPDVIKDMAQQFEKKLEGDPSLLERLAKYEHMRWCCFELTRGWMPVDPDQVVQFMNAGSTRHILQIAKLHPCICSWNDLVTLDSILSFEAVRKIDMRYGYSDEELTSLMDKRFTKYYSADNKYTYFQDINLEEVKATAKVMQESLSKERILETQSHVR